MFIWEKHLLLSFPSLLRVAANGVYSIVKPDRTFNGEKVTMKTYLTGC